MVAIIEKGGVMGGFSDFFNTKSLERDLERAARDVVRDGISGATGASRGTVRSGERGDIGGVVSGAIRDRQRAAQQAERAEAQAQRQFDNEQRRYDRAQDRWEQNSERFADKPDYLERERVRFEEAQQRYVDAHIERYGEPPSGGGFVPTAAPPPGFEGGAGAGGGAAPRSDELSLNDDNRVRPGASGVDLEGDYVSAAASGEIQFGEQKLTEVNGKIYCTTVAGDEIASYDVTDQMGGTPEIAQNQQGGQQFDRGGINISGFGNG